MTDSVVMEDQVVHSACYRKRLLAGIFALFSFSLSGTASAGDDITNYLPKDDVIHGRVMELAAPREIQVLAQKLQAAVQNDQEWFQAFVAENAEVRPLPYHPRLGLTEVEYQRMLALAEVVEMQQIGSVTLTVKHLKDGGVELVSQGEPTPLNEVRLYPVKGFVETGYGDLNEISEINQSNADSATGRWIGTQWKKSQQSSDKLLAVKLAIGKRTDHGDGIIYYDVKNYAPGVAEAYSYVLLYPLQ